jgi:hypothetical protein
LYFLTAQLEQLTQVAVAVAVAKQTAALAHLVLL